MKYSVTVTTSFQGKCAFVNLGKKASELTVADVSRSEISLLISSFLIILSVFAAVNIFSITAAIQVLIIRRFICHIFNKTSTGLNLKIF